MLANVQTSYMTPVLSAGVGAPTPYSPPLPTSILVKLHLVNTREYALVSKNMEQNLDDALASVLNVPASVTLRSHAHLDTGRGCNVASQPGR